MSEQNYSDDFKAKVVLQATSPQGASPAEIAEQHGMTVRDLVSWAMEMDLSSEDIQRLKDAAGDESDGASSDVTLTGTSEVFTDDIRYGMSRDLLDIKKVAFWTFFGSGFVALLVIGLILIYSVATTDTIQQVYAESGDNYDVSQLKAQQAEHLNSFGVLDTDEGVYHVPIDAVIEQMAAEADE
ncbi:MAG: hypothetical protein WD115_04895 [Balneolaceae bacterium]